MTRRRKTGHQVPKRRIRKGRMPKRRKDWSKQIVSWALYSFEGNTFFHFSPFCLFDVLALRRFGIRRFVLRHFVTHPSKWVHLEYNFFLKFRQNIEMQLFWNFFVNLFGNFLRALVSLFPNFTKNRIRQDFNLLPNFF